MIKGKNQNLAFLFAIIAVVFWSTVPTAFKLGLKYQSNYQLLTGASLISLLFLSLTLLFQGKLKHIKALKASDLGRSALLGLMNPVVYYLILFEAYSRLPAQVAQPINMIWPIVLVLISIPILHQKISKTSILAMLLSFLGVAVISFQGGSIFEGNSNLTGILLAILSAVIWAFYWIFNMKNRLDPVVVLFLNFSFASVYLIGAGLFRKDFLPQGNEAWLSAAYVGIFEMGLTFVLWLRALQLSSSTAKISNLIFIAPFINLIFVNLILGENVYISTIFGIILVVSGILMQNYNKK